MPFVSLYRKYRSQTFSDLMGQEHVVRTLQNAISSGRVSHSYLFTGPRGTGKTSTARLLAKALNCENGPTPEPDNVCAICREITAGTSVDVIELDAASESGVDQIRDVIVNVADYRPMASRYKIFIIDEVHDLSPKAFDALLKTIEEPPEHLIFILATTEFSKVPPTIRSRCQKFEFHRASMEDLEKRLLYVAGQEGVSADAAAYKAIARMADGGFRDALTLLEQAMLTSDGPITQDHVYDQLGMVSEEAVDDLLLAMRKPDVPKIMSVLAEIAQRGRDPRAIVESILYRLADLTRASYEIELGGLDATREAALHHVATELGRETILRMRSALADAHRVIRDITLPRLWLESELVRIATAAAPAQVVQAAAPAPRTKEPEKKPSLSDAAQRLAAATPPAEKPAKKPVEKPSEPAEVPGPGTSPKAPEPAQVWAKVVAHVVEKYHGKRLELALTGSEVVKFDGSELTIGLTRQLQVDWMNESPQRLGGLAGMVREAGGEGWTVRVEALPRQAMPDQPSTVELPLEGEQLSQFAKDMFAPPTPGSSGDSENP